MKSDSHKIKVLFILPSLKRAGAETQTIDLVNGLSSEQFEKHLLSFESEMDLLDRIDANSVVYHHLPRNTKLDWALARKIGQLLNDLQIDIMHCSLMIALFWGWVGRLNSKRSKIPLMVSLHTTTNRNRRADFFDYIVYQWLLRACSKVIFVCVNQQQHWIRRFPFLMFKAQCIHNGIDIHRFEPSTVRQEGIALKHQLGLSDTDIVISQIAAFRQEKGHLIMLEAFKQLRDQLNNVHLLLAGDGPLKPIITNKIAELGVQNAVHLLGALPDVRPLLAVSSITVLASTAVETFSMAMLESLAMQVPMIATDIGGAGEAIRPGQTGYLVPPNDPPALVEAVKDFILLKNRDAMGVQGRILVEKLFRRDLMLEKYEKLFEDEVGGSL